MWKIKIIIKDTRRIVHIAQTLDSSVQWIGELVHGSVTRWAAVVAFVYVKLNSLKMTVRLYYVLTLHMYKQTKRKVFKNDGTP